MKKTSISRAERSSSPNDIVIYSGVYEVRHHRHRFPHEATLLEGEIFPECSYCGNRVVFTLVRPANRIELDYDFEHHRGPVLVKG